MLEILLQYVLPSFVAGGLGLAAILMGKSRDRKAAAESAKQDRINEQFPGWAELVAENRALRAELSGLQERLDEVRAKVETILTRESRWMAAVARIFRRIEALWPTENGPDLDPADIAALEDTDVIPPKWIRRP